MTEEERGVGRDPVRPTNAEAPTRRSAGISVTESADRVEGCDGHGGAVVIDLAGKGESDRRRALMVLDVTPSGARVVVHVGGLLVDYDLFLILRAHAGRVRFDFRADDPATVTRWVRAVRSGRLPGMPV